MSEWTLGGVVDAIAEAIPDRTMTLCGDRRTTYGDMALDANTGTQELDR